jgi:pimeloyl-ACP methyl ester carboxylesterase
MAITTVILVHGAWHGAWCWQPLIPELLKQRLAPFTLDLPAHGVHARFPEGWGDDAARLAVSPAPTSGITLDDYAAAVLEVVDAERAPEKIGRLVYLAAFMPLPGTPMIDYVRCAENAGEEVAGLFVAPPPKIGAMRIDFRNAALHERIRSAFAHDMDATHFAAMNYLLTPDVPAGPVATPTVATRQRWGRVPRAYIRCSEDRAVMPALQDRFIHEADAWTPENPTRVLTLAASHSPFLSMPEQLAQALADLTA